MPTSPLPMPPIRRSGRVPRLRRKPPADDPHKNRVAASVPDATPASTTSSRPESAGAAAVDTAGSPAASDESSEEPDPQYDSPESSDDDEQRAEEDALVAKIARLLPTRTRAKLREATIGVVDDGTMDWSGEWEAVLARQRGLNAKREALIVEGRTIPDGAGAAAEDGGGGRATASRHQANDATITPAMVSSIRDTVVKLCDEAALAKRALVQRRHKDANGNAIYHTGSAQRLGGQLGRPASAASLMAGGLTSGSARQLVTGGPSSSAHGGGGESGQGGARGLVRGASDAAIMGRGPTSASSLASGGARGGSRLARARAGIARPEWLPRGSAFSYSPDLPREVLDRPSYASRPASASCLRPGSAMSSQSAPASALAHGRAAHMRPTTPGAAARSVPSLVGHHHRPSRPTTAEGARAVVVVAPSEMVPSAMAAGMRGSAGRRTQAKR